MWCQFVVFYMTTCGLLLLISYVKSYWWSFFPFDKFSKFEFIQNGKTQMNSFYLFATDSKTRTKIRMHSCRMRTTHSYGGGMHGKGACMAGGVYGKRVCMARGGGMCGRGHSWQGDMHGRGDVCGRRGMHGGGTCVAGGCAWQRGVHGKGACMAGGHAWQRGNA